MKSATVISFIGIAVLASLVKAQDQPTPPNHEELKAKMGWMIGTWERKTEDGSQHEFDCRWVLDKQFIRGTVAIGNPLEEILHIMMGWDPIEKKLTVNGFSRFGGQSSGKCINTADNELHFALKGVSPEGPVSLTLVYAHPAEDTLVVEYRNVVVGDQKSDPFKVEFKRKGN